MAAGFSVVLIDLDLPGQDGFSLIYEMRHHFPDLPIIFQRRRSPRRAGERDNLGRCRGVAEAG